MADPLATVMAKLFTDLIGRSVSFSERMEPTPSPAEQAFAVYIVHPMGSVRVIRADTLLLASFGGALMGLPSDTVKQRMARSSVDASLYDALLEVMNIASRVVSLEYRAVFRSIYPDTGSLPAEARETVRNPCYSNHFDVTVDGYDGGRLSLLAPI